MSELAVKVEPAAAITLTWLEMTQIGEATFSFSEELTPLDKLPVPLNLSEVNNTAFLDLSYKNNVDATSAKQPAMTSWQLTEFSSTQMKLKVDFENPLYVSTGDTADELSLRIVQPLIF